MRRNPNNRGFARLSLLGLIVGGAISFGMRLWLINPNSGVGQIVHSWVIIPIGLVFVFSLYQIFRMMKDHAWGCFPIVCFLLGGVAVWFIPIN